MSLQRVVVASAPSGLRVSVAEALAAPSYEATGVSVEAYAAISADLHFRDRRASTSGQMTPPTFEMSWRQVYGRRRRFASSVRGRMPSRWAYCVGLSVRNGRSWRMSRRRSAWWPRLNSRSHARHAPDSSDSPSSRPCQPMPSGPIAQLPDGRPGRRRWAFGCFRVGRRAGRRDAVRFRHIARLRLAAVPRCRRELGPCQCPRPRGRCRLRVRIVAPVDSPGRRQGFPRPDVSSPTAWTAPQGDGHRLDERRDPRDHHAQEASRLLGEAQAAAAKADPGSLPEGVRGDVDALRVRIGPRVDGGPRAHRCRLLAFRRGGQDGQRSPYLLVFQNQTELRATGASWVRLRKSVSTGVG